MTPFSGNHQDSSMNPLLFDSLYLKIMADPILHETTPLKQSSESTVDKLTNIDKKRKTRTGSGSGSGHVCSSNSGQSKKPKGDEQEPPRGYIHVRARRGQATDSHSLAERVRREKISEKMETLQRLVPGCGKVAGKALMLDEIITYVQTLQNQVEFLSMKIASVNPLFFDLSLAQDSFIFSPEENMHASPLPQCSPSDQSTVFAHNDFVDISAFSQENGNLLWDAEEQGQKFLNQNLCSFN